MGFRCPRAWYRIVATPAKMESTRVSHRFTRKSEARCFSPRNETACYTHHSRASTALCQRPLDRAELALEPTPASPYTDQALLSSVSNRKKLKEGAKNRRILVAGDRYSAIPTYDIALFSYRRRAARGAICSLAQLPSIAITRNRASKWLRSPPAPSRPDRW